MKYLLIFFISFPVIGFSQKFKSSVVSTSGAIAKYESIIVIHDSSMTIVDSKNNKIAYQITKRIDSTYFRVTDGIKDCIVRISFADKPNKVLGFKYSHVISLEFDKGNISYYSIRE